jgi:hypothetical protein
VVSRNRWLQDISHSALAWLTEGAAIFQEFDHQILIGTPSKQNCQPNGSANSRKRLSGARLIGCRTAERRAKGIAVEA